MEIHYTVGMENFFTVKHGQLAIQIAMEIKCAV
jgi:hypothetical protein